VTVSTASGQTIGTQTFDALAGDAWADITLQFPIPAVWESDMLSVGVEIETARAGQVFHRSYKNLPSIPVVENSTQTDMLDFRVPLHRLSPSPSANVSRKTLPTCRETLRACRDDRCGRGLRGFQGVLHEM
jgi:hypothetical protein